MKKNEKWNSGAIEAGKRTRRGLLNVRRVLEKLTDLPSHLRSTAYASSNLLSLHSTDGRNGNSIVETAREYRAALLKAFGQWSDEMVGVEHYYGKQWYVAWSGKQRDVEVTFKVYCTRPEIEEENILKEGCEIVETTEHTEAHDTVTLAVECST